MSWLKRNVGLDWFDLFVHLGVTSMFIGWAAMENAEEAFPVISIISLIGDIQPRWRFLSTSLSCSPRDSSAPTLEETLIQYRTSKPRS